VNNGQKSIGVQEKLDLKKVSELLAYAIMLRLNDNSIHTICVKTVLCCALLTPLVTLSLE